MVNISAVQRIKRFIQDEDLRPMKPWKDRLFGRRKRQRNQYWANLKKNIRMILGLLSGGDITDMLKSILYKKELRTLCEGLDDIQALRNLADCYERINLKKRHPYVRALKRSKISRLRMRHYGFNISHKLWSTCEDAKERDQGGGQPIPQPLRQSIKTYLDENSRIAANRLTINKDSDDEENYKKTVPAKILEKSITDLYKAFPLANQISISTFLKYARKTNIYKKPQRLTDLCDYCEKARSIKQGLAKRLEQFKYACNGTFDTQHMKQFLVEQREQLHNANQCDIINKLFEDISSYEVLLFHQNIARTQRDAYNSQRTSVEELRNKLLIEVDFKQKITIGFGPRQLNTEYYDKRQKTRTCLGFGIYYVDEHDQIKLINFDIIASDDSQEARVVIRGFRLLREEAFFRNIDKREYTIWMDCGKHFRNSIVVGYLFRDLAKENITVNLNFFCEKHGKNARDAHFSMVSRFVQAESLRKRLTSSKDVADAIEKGQKKANENKAFQVHKKTPKKNEPVVTYAMALDFRTMLNYKNKHPQLQRLIIKNFESFYNFKTHIAGNQITIAASLLSNSANSTEINQIKFDQIIPVYDIQDEDILDDMKLSVQSQNEKRDRISFVFDHLKKIPTSQTKILNGYETNNEQLGNKPNYCRDRKVGNKPACTTCQAECSLSIEHLIRDEYNQETVLAELGNHHHAKYRDVPNVNRAANDTRMIQPRNKKEGARELAEHYAYSHKLKMPS